MKRAIMLVAVLSFLLIFSGCAMYANHNYGLSMHRDIEIRSGTAMSEIFSRFGPPDQIHETGDHIYYVFTGQSAMTIMGVVSRVQSEAMVVQADRDGRVQQSYFVKSGEGSTYAGPPDLFIKIEP